MTAVGPGEIHPADDDREIAARQAVMAVSAAARREELDSVLAALAPLPEASDLRRPETGLVMTRGRAGGDGAPFNLGEATVTRAAVRIAEGGRTVNGFAYHLGRDAARARAAAIIDALWQLPGRRQAVEAALAPVHERLTAERETAARRTAATRVNFFTMIRGED
ncbi:phosphonate C-P lyase system protein PhnG [Chelatococcus daeguensis]|uniref:phosphonate C-P lyase system protein PhnG n=1 Tax=Chelatococcus daeguensis TaxID=444444 RepID=UPI0009EF4CD8|nr:phosphonate C-P lyase system protein PhnG [Chelatococcus daeguensis]MBM3082353.1 phosphonate C-P lyase system protein PhnG [Chelatococcus daeguensis]